MRVFPGSRLTVLLLPLVFTYGAAASLPASAGPTGCDSPPVSTGAISGIIRTAGGEAFDISSTFSYRAVKLFREGERVQAMHRGPVFSGSGSAVTYTLSGLTPGRYYVRLGDPTAAYGPPMSAPRYAATWYSNTTRFDQARVITVTAGMTVTGIDGALTLGGSITGRVTFLGPPPVSSGATPGAYVELHDASGHVIDTTFINSNGMYIFEDGIASGAYRVRVWAMGYDAQFYGGSSTTQTASIVNVVAPNRVTDINFTMQPATRGVKGRVVAQNGGAPISNAKLSAWVSDGYFSGDIATYTNAAGYFTLTLPAGQHTIVASSGFDHAGKLVSVTVASGFVTLPDIALADAARLTGRFVNSATLSGLSFSENVYPYFFDPAGGQADIAVIRITRALDGSFVIGSIPSGRYKIQWRSDQFHDSYYNRQYTFAAAQLITVNAPATIALGDIMLVPCSEPNPGPRLTPTPTRSPATATAQATATLQPGPTLTPTPTVITATATLQATATLEPTPGMNRRLYLPVIRR